MNDPEWSLREDGRAGEPPVKRESAQARTTTFLVMIAEPTPFIARVTIKQQWGGDWSIDPGRMWTPEPQQEDGA